MSDTQTAMPLFNEPDIFDILGGPVVDIFRRVFGAAEVAEAEIQKLRLSAAEASDLFRECQPPSCFANENLASWLYLAYVRELCLRLKNKEELSKGTYAEAAVLLKNTSLAAPLNARGLLAYRSVLLRAMQLAEEPPPIWMVQGDWPHEPWEGATNEFLSDAIHKAGQVRRSV